MLPAPRWAAAGVATAVVGGAYVLWRRRREQAATRAEKWAVEADAFVHSTDVPAIEPDAFYSVVRQYEASGFVKLTGLAPDEIDAWVSAFSAHYELCWMRPGAFKDREAKSGASMAPSYEKNSDDVVRPHSEMDHSVRMCFFMVEHPGDRGGEGIMIDVQSLDKSKWRSSVVDGRVFLGHVATRLDERMYGRFLAFCATNGLLLNDKHERRIVDLVAAERAKMSEAQFAMKFGTGEASDNFSDAQLEELFSHASVHTYAAGELYIFDNRKWMHSRTQFAGPRKLRVAFLFEAAVGGSGLEPRVLDPRFYLPWDSHRIDPHSSSRRGSEDDRSRLACAQVGFAKVLKSNAMLLPPYPTRVSPASAADHALAWKHPV